MDESHATHLGQLATHATQLHKEAMALVNPGASVAQLQIALDKLAQVELLAQDLESWNAFPQVETALAHLADQQAALRLAIARIESGRGEAPQVWKGWRWISLASVLLLAVSLAT